MKCIILNFSSNPNTNYISIPLNDDFVIAVYVTTHSEDGWDSSHQIVMKTMPNDEFIPAEDFSEDKTLIKIEYPGQNEFIVFVLLLILLVIFFFVCSLLLKNKSFTKRTHNWMFILILWFSDIFYVSFSFNLLYQLFLPFLYRFTLIQS